jgi:hypothetical protein
MPVPATDVAGQYLKGAGLPDTPTNRVVVGSWLIQESGYPGKFGYLYAPGEKQGTAAYWNNYLGQNYTSGMSWASPNSNAQFSSPEAAGAAWGALLKSNAYPGYGNVYQYLNNGNSGNEALAAITVASKSWGTNTKNLMPTANMLTGFYNVQPVNAFNQAPALNPSDYLGFLQQVAGQANYVAPDTLAATGAAANPVNDALKNGLGAGVWFATHLTGIIAILGGGIVVILGVYFMAKSSGQVDQPPQEHTLVRTIPVFRGASKVA